MKVIPSDASSSYESAQCRYYDANECRSCDLLSARNGGRLPLKSSGILGILEKHGVTAINLEPLRIPTSPWGSRRKVKMSVSGSLESPRIGLAQASGLSQDLCGCPLMPASIQGLLEDLKPIIRDARLVPYDITLRRGELKGITVMINRSESQGIVRFVLRSSEAVPRIKKVLDALCCKHAWIKAVSCNIQPLHAAIPEGPEEIFLTSVQTMEERYADVPLFFSPQSFMQVTPEIAEVLYQRAARFAREHPIRTVLDLFCGVGGFSLAVAPFVERVDGVELSHVSIENASRAAQQLGYPHTHFVAADVDKYIENLDLPSPDLIIANPPRRGLSDSLKARLLKIAPAYFIYSSCNPETFARDAAALASRYKLEILAPFDMFPLTTHCELLGVFLR